MTQKKYDITQEGLEKLKAEYEQLVSIRRKEVAEKIKRAREMGAPKTTPNMKMPKMNRPLLKAA